MAGGRRRCGFRLLESRRPEPGLSCSRSGLVGLLLRRCNYFCFVKLLLVAVAVAVAAAVAVKAVVGECKQLHHENSGHCMEADSCAGAEFWRMLASHSSLAGSACASGRTKKRTLFVTRRLACRLCHTGCALLGTLLTSANTLVPSSPGEVAPVG